MSAWQKSVIGVALLLIIARFSGITDGLNRWLTDKHWCWRAALDHTPFPRDIVIVAIDDKTVNSFGRLKYWSRAKYADLLDRMPGAMAVGIDILFTEEDKLNPAGDRKLADAIARQGKVVLGCFRWREARPLADADSIAVTGTIKRLPIPSDLSALSSLAQVQPTSLDPPIALLRSRAAAVGILDVNADSDGVYRTPQIVALTQDNAVSRNEVPGPRLLPHMTLATAALAVSTDLGAALEGPGSLQLGNRAIRLAGGALTLRPIVRRGGGHETNAVGRPAPTISFADALKADPATFEGKIVLVGETATGTSDIRPNPLDNALRGIELNAEIIANLLYLPRVAPMGAGLTWLLILAALAVPLWAYSRLSPVQASAAAGVGFVAVVGVMEIAFWSMNVIPAWAPVLIVLVAGALLMSVQRYAQEEALKRRIRESFSVYVSPAVVESIVSDPEIAGEEGTRQPVAVLMSDIRDFTPYCEQHEPEFVVRQMREYLEEMSAAVDDAVGVLDKYIGDAVMALFGPFLPREDNKSAQAIRCALDMLDRLSALNERWREEDIPEFRIGIGIHAGEAIVGNVGGYRRMQYTALGDTVNLAARIEGLTKTLGVQVIVTEAAMREAADVLATEVEFIPLGQHTVKGRDQAVPLYEARRIGNR